MEEFVKSAFPLIFPEVHMHRVLQLHAFLSHQKCLFRPAGDEAAGGVYDAVAGHDARERIDVQRIPHSARGARASAQARDLAVACNLAAGDFLHRRVDTAEKIITFCFALRPSLTGIRIENYSALREIFDENLPINRLAADLVRAFFLENIAPMLVKLFCGNRGIDLHK